MCKGSGRGNESRHHCSYLTYPTPTIPPLCRPTATKFIGGHSDVTAGILAVRDKQLADRLYFLQVLVLLLLTGVRGWRAICLHACPPGWFRLRACRLLCATASHVATAAHSPHVMAQNAEGSALGPFDCWLLVRGLKTMSLRMERQVGGSWAACVGCRV